MQSYVYLDTNVFSLIAGDLSIQSKFSSQFKKNKVVISTVTISELFEKETKFQSFNKLINNKNLDFLFLGAYPRIMQLEINNYPNNVNIETVSMNPIVSQILDGKPFDFSDLNKSKRFVAEVQNQRTRANQDFRKIIDKWKSKFPPDNNNSYSKQYQSKLRNMVKKNIKTDISKSLPDIDLDLSKFKTRLIIIESLIKKYLFNPIRNFDPNDFTDIMHIAYSPYMDYFITEKNNFDVLNQIKKATNLLDKTSIIKISEFKDESI
jgi:hypothetical protein